MTLSSKYVALIPSNNHSLMFVHLVLMQKQDVKTLVRSNAVIDLQRLQAAAGPT